VVEAIAQRAAEIAIADLRRSNGDCSPWLSGAGAAADYLGVPRARVYKRLAKIPHHRDGARLMFRRDDLDAWLEGQRETG
jgi:excisionase family DNA binding protein